MHGTFARVISAAVLATVALTACAEFGPGDEYGSQSAAAGSDNLTTPVVCPPPKVSSDPQQVLCTDPTSTTQVAGGYFSVIGEPRRLVEAAQTFLAPGPSPRVPGRLTVKLNRVFDPPAGTTPELTVEIRPTLPSGKPDPNLPGVPLSDAHLPYTALPLGAGIFTQVTMNLTTQPGLTMPVGSTYAIVFRVVTPAQLTLGIAAHVDSTVYSDGTGLTRQMRLIGSNTFNTTPFVADKRDMNIALSFDDGCTVGFQYTCGVGECFVAVDQCTNGNFNTCVPKNPTPEQCNGKDDDCDGKVDEIQPDANGPGLGTTTCGIGACQNTMDNCAGGKVQLCQEKPKQTETCNGIDDDCDGLVDEVADLGTTTCGWGACAKTVINCVNALPVTCVPDMSKKGAEICDGLNNDCDGVPANRSYNTAAVPADTPYDPQDPKYIDNNADYTKLTRAYYGAAPATRNVGVCRDGVQTCASTPGSGVAAWNVTTSDVEPSTDKMYNVYDSTKPASPLTQRGTFCDGLDQDCDGTVDGVGGVKNRIPAEPWPQYPQPPSSTPPPDAACWTGAAANRNVGECRDGYLLCAAPVSGNGQQTAETASACLNQTFPTSETCNGKDDDCNGSIDDMGQTKVCGNGRCAKVVANCTNGVAGNCPAGGDLSQARTEACNGYDDDCDGVVDKTAGGQDLTQSCYTGPAGTLNVGVCRAGSQTCTSYMSPLPVTPNSPPAYPGTGTWTACGGQILPGTETCNGVDDNCDGAIDNPSTSLCALTAGAAATNCAGATCSITACAAGRFDSNNSYADGCECIDDGATTGTTCPGSPTSLGSLGKGSSTSYSGKVPNLSLSDYFTVSFPPTGLYASGYAGAVSLSLTSNPGSNYRFQVLNPGCSAFGSCGATLDTFYYADTCYAGNPSDCTVRSSSWPSTLVVRVFRTSTSAGGCAGYTLSASYL